MLVWSGWYLLARGTLKEVTWHLLARGTLKELLGTCWQETPWKEYLVPIKRTHLEYCGLNTVWGTWDSCGCIKGHLDLKWCFQMSNYGSFTTTTCYHVYKSLLHYREIEKECLICKALRSGFSDSVQGLGHLKQFCYSCNWIIIQVRKGSRTWLLPLYIAFVGTFGKDWLRRVLSIAYLKNK